MQHQNSFYVDDDGVPLPPEQATSVAIADSLLTRMRNQGASADANNNSDEIEKQKRDWVREHNENAVKFLRTITTYSDGGGGAGFDAIRSAAAAMLEAQKIIDDLDNSEDDDDDGQEPAAAAHIIDGDDECGFTREESDIGPDGEWILDRIIQRKMMLLETTGQQDGGDDDNDDDANAVGVSRSAKRRRPVPHYQCAWKYYEGELTWEPRHVLEDLGYGKQVADFDSKHSASTKPLSLEERRRINAAKAAARAAEEQANQKKKAIPTKTRHQANINGPLPCCPRVTCFGTMRTTIFEDLFPDIVSWAFQQLHAAGMLLVGMANIAPPRAAAAFLQRWILEGEAATPVRVFHGTAEQCVAPICKMGLVVPGEREGVTVRNGSAHGKGIYSSRNCGESRSYCHGSNCMFLCVGMALPELEASQRIVSPGAWHVFFESSLICPVWLLQFNVIEYNGEDDEPKPSQLNLYESYGAMLRTKAAMELQQEQGQGDEERLMRPLAVVRSQLQEMKVEAERQRLASMTQEERDEIERAKQAEIQAKLDAEAAEKVRAFNAAREKAAALQDTPKIRKVPGGKVTKKMIKQLPRSMKEVFGF